MYIIQYSSPGVPTSYLAEAGYVLSYTMALAWARRFTTLGAARAALLRLQKNDPTRAHMYWIMERRPGREWERGLLDDPNGQA